MPTAHELLDRLEEVADRVRQLEADFADCNRERERWKDEAMRLRADLATWAGIDADIWAEDEPAPCDERRNGEDAQRLRAQPASAVVSAASEAPLPPLAAGDATPTPEMEP